MEKMVKIHNEYNGRIIVLPMEETILSIFDELVGGQIATDGKYYVIRTNYKTKEDYAIPKDNALEFYKIGRILNENEVAVFNGEKVRGMTLREEYLYNSEQLNALVDIWGNICNNNEVEE